MQDIHPYLCLTNMLVSYWLKKDDQEGSCLKISRIRKYIGKKDEILHWYWPIQDNIRIYRISFLPIFSFYRNQ